MPTRIVLALDSSLPADLATSCRDFCTSLATYLGEPVLLASLDGELVDDLRAWTLGRTQGAGLEGVEPRGSATTSAAMTDRPEPWSTSGKLALYGGPPERKPDDAIVATGATEPAPAGRDVTGELRRGIWEATGLFAEPASRGWLAVSCPSRQMAAWMCAAIILENVEARCEEETLYLPASPSFEVNNQVQSLIRVVAKVHHYWQAQTLERPAGKE